MNLFWKLIIFAIVVYLIGDAIAPETYTNGHLGQLLLGIASAVWFCLIVMIDGERHRKESSGGRE